MHKLYDTKPIQNRNSKKTKYHPLPPFYLDQDHHHYQP